MTNQKALDYVREHLTTLHANPNIYEDGTCNVIRALEEVVVPLLEFEIRCGRAIDSMIESLSGIPVDLALSILEKNLSKNDGEVIY